MSGSCQGHQGDQAATIGREGMVGLPVFLGAASTPHAAFCPSRRVGGSAVKITAHLLRRVLADDGALHQALSRFTQTTMVQIAQNVVCNSTHATIQRAARWLLTTRDRVGDEFLLTQEFLGQMLGVRRPTVSEVARRLQAEGLIRYRRASSRSPTPPPCSRWLAPATRSSRPNSTSSLA
jgi:CRP-like cAMP-binding protein